MPRIVLRTDQIKHLAIENGINPTAHAIALATGLTYETVRRALAGGPVSEKTIAALMAYFAAPFESLCALTPDDQAG